MADIAVGTVDTQENTLETDLETQETEENT